MQRRRLLAASTCAALGATLLPGCTAPAPRAAASAAPRRMLWAANVRTKPLPERLAAARAGGFADMSMFPIDYRRLRDAGVGPAGLRAMLDDAGVAVRVCDPFVQWVPRFALPAGYPADYLAFVDHDEAAIFEMAETLGARTVNCVEPFGQRYGAAELTDALGAFAERARRRGLRVTLEFMPISGIPDLAAGWEIVRALPASQVGLCFDTWHFHRSTPDHALLATVPPDRIFEVQLADARRALQAPTLTEDLLRFRLLPGEGELDLRRTVDLLRARGAWTSVGPEVFSDAMDALPAEEVGRRTGSNLTRWLA